MKTKKFIFLAIFFFIAAGLLFFFSPLRVLILGFQKGEVSKGEIIEKVVSEPSYCIDSDNGIDYYIKGFVDTNPALYGDEIYDYCDSQNLIEYYCVGNEKFSESYTCPNGCKDGKCKSKASESEEMRDIACSDSDEGVNIWLKGTATGLDEAGNSFTYEDYCVVENGTTGLIEFFCENNKVIENFFGINGGCYNCVDGACKEEVFGEERSVEEKQKVITCNDSDNGKSYYTKGNTSIYENNLLLGMYFDYCKNSEVIVEFFCEGNNAISEEFICPSGNECKDGSCVRIAQTPQPQQPPAKTPSTCSDSDNGLNYYVFGIAIDSSNPQGLRDYCIGNSLIEYYCQDFGNEGYKIDFQKYFCSNGCYNGACSECIEGQEVCVNSEFINSCKNGKWILESCASKCQNCICNTSLNKCVEKKLDLIILSCPSDTICKSYWPTDEGPKIEVNGGYQASCNLFEVCNPVLDKYVEEARNACLGSSNQKKCMGFYIINALGIKAKFMKGYFTPEICCSGDINDPVDRDHCRDFSYFGKCDSKEDPILSFNSFTQQLNCNAPISKFGWVSDTDMSKNTCKFITPPAHATLDILKTGTCEDYSVVLTTLLRKAGYSPEEVMSVDGFRHAYNLVKFPGDTKYHFIDTTGNGKGSANNVFRLYDTPLGKSRFKIYQEGRVGNTEVEINSYIYYDYCNLPMEKCYNDKGVVSCPKKEEIYGCDKTHQYYLDSCKVRQGPIKATCDECWYKFTSPISVEGCCRIKEWWGQYTKCEEGDIYDVIAQI